MTTPVNIDFITTENIELLWEIILDDIKDKFRTKEHIAHARGFYINQARIFFEREKSINQKLVQMNKNFITQIMTSFSSLKQQPHQQQQSQQQQSQQQQQQQQQQQPQKINILNSAPDGQGHFTIEDLHSERMNAFEKSLAEKQNDFNSAMTISVPEAPNFNDGKLDEPIGGSMSELIARTLAQRNFDMEEIHKGANKEDVAKWLKPKETSTKVEKVQQYENHKIQMDQKQIQYQYAQQEPPKLIQIGQVLENTDVKYDALAQPGSKVDRKQISWGTNSEYESTELNGIRLNIQEIEGKSLQKGSDNIFSKLKYVKEEENSYDVKTELKNMNDRINNLDEKMNKILEFINRNTQ